MDIYLEKVGAAGLVFGVDTGWHSDNEVKSVWFYTDGDICHSRQKASVRGLPKISLTTEELVKMLWEIYEQEEK